MPLKEKPTGRGEEMQVVGLAARTGYRALSFQELRGAGLRASSKVDALSGSTSVTSFLLKAMSLVNGHGSSS